MIIFLIIMFVPPIILALVGNDKLREKETKSAKIYFILAATYLIIGLGLCGGMFF